MTEKPTEDWTLFASEDYEGPSIWRVRDSYPPDLKRTDFPTSVIVEWSYADDGPPSKQILDELHKFEALLEPLNDAGGNSLLVHIIRGDGVSELCYYCRDYDAFMSQLNTELKGSPHFPIEILHDNDPDWNYCRQTKEALTSVDG